MRATLAFFALTVGAAASAQEGSYRVTGGSQAPLGRWDDAVGVVFQNSYVGCTGTLVAPNVVITAGHCIGGISHVLVGSNDWNTDRGEMIRVSRQRAHNTADIGVLVLAEDSTYEPRIIAQGCVLDDYLYDGAPVAVVGYGAIDERGNDYTSELREGYTVVTDSDCSATNRGCQPNISPGGEIGAGGDGVDACFGDSGGPLYLQSEVGDYVVGVTSRGFYDVQFPCGEGGIWVRPDAFLDWIEEETGVELPVPTCNFLPELDPEFMAVPQGKSRDVKMRADDAEGNDLTWSIARQGEHGTAEVDADGRVTYTADDDYLGVDSVIVAVTDEGVPSHTVEAELQIEVVEHTFLGCGCSTEGTSGGVGAAGALAGLIALRRRRR
jgi:MYXO-CTERM domain-containing protein